MTIRTFLHCRDCIAELPVGVSPREWMRFEFGTNAEGNLEVWCVRHEKHLATFMTIKGEA